MTRSVRVSAFVAGLVAGVAAVPAWAQQQTGSRQQERGLFGGGYGDAAQSLTFDTQIGGGYDGNIALAQPGSATLGSNFTQLAAPGSRMGDATGTLSYQISQKTFSLQSSVGGWANYYPALRQSLLDGVTAGVALAWKATSRSTLNFQQGISDQPLFVLFPVGAAPADLNLPANAAPLYSTGAALETQLASTTALNFSQKLAPRLTANVSGAYFGTQAVPEAPGITTITGSAGLGFALTKGLQLQIGYGETEARYDFGGVRSQATSSSVTGGLNFSHALSLTRNTHLSFAMGTTYLSFAGQSTLYLEGNALLTRDIGRTWAATLGYTRNINYVQTFAAPYLSDSVGLGLGGLVSRRVSLQFGGGATRGTVGLGPAGGSVSDVYGSAGGSLAITRNVAVRIDYTYLRYDIAASVLLPTGLARRLDRQSVRATLELWVPILRVLRRPDAAR